MRIIAIDPGYSGAWALTAHGRPMMVGDMPVAGEGASKRVSTPALAEAIRVRLPDLVVVENVHSFPGEGVSSAFKFGASFGAVLGIIGALGLPLELVEPQVWKRHHKLIGKDKEANRQKAIDLAPHLASSLARKLDHGRADAILLALYAVDAFRGPRLPWKQPEQLAALAPLGAE